MNEYKPSSELNNIPLASAEEERRRAAAWMDTAAQFSRNQDYWRERAQQAEAFLDIPVHGTPKAIKDFLEKFDDFLVPIYMKIAPNCWEHCHPDHILINCSMDMQKNFKVLGLTKIDETLKYRDI